MKKYVSMCAALVMAFALAVPTVALAASEQLSKATATGSAATGAVEASVSFGGSGQIEVTPNFSEEASNTQVADDEQVLATFRYAKSGDVSGPYAFSYALGSAFAGKTVSVFVDHEGAADNEVLTVTADASGTIAFTTTELSIHTIVVKKADAEATASAPKASANTSSTSPQTGLANSVVVAGVVVAAAVAAALVGRALVSGRDGR